MPFPCKVCKREWSGLKRVHCGECHENFSSTSAFDKHRVKFKCVDPKKRGLELREGYWSFPGSTPYGKR